MHIKLNSLPIKNFEKLCLLIVLFQVTSGCSSSATTGKNYAFAMTLMPFFGYSGEPLEPAVEFTVYRLANPLSAYTDFEDSVTLAAYSDSKCSQAAAGSFTVATNPLPLASGVSLFSGMSFAWTETTAEGTLYFKGTLAGTGVSYCSIGTPILQHFNLGVGYLSLGVPGAAGAATSALVEDRGKAVQITSNGRYLVAGTSKNATNGHEAALWKFLPNGSLDTTFGTSGVVHFGSTGVGGGTEDIVADMRLDSSGKAILVGSTTNASGGKELAIWKYQSTGAIDTTFGTSGSLHSGAPGIAGVAAAANVVDEGLAVRIDSQGLLNILGTTKNLSNGTELFLRRYSANGTLDSTFGTSGTYHSGTTGAAGATGAATFDVGKSFEIDSQGRLIVTGLSVNASGKKEMAIWRFTKNGAPDTTWGTQGVLVFGSTGAAGGTGGNLHDEGNSLLIDSENRYLIVGSSLNAAGATELAIWRYTESGTLDSEFNSTGVLHFGTSGVAGATGVNTQDVGLSVSEDSDSNYVIVGTSRNASLGTELTIWKYKSDGTLDTEFQSTGYLHFGSTGTAGATGSNTLDVPYSLKIDTYGTYIITGTSKNTSNGTELSMWRYLPSGDLNL
jgi:uncharacterized delta-60 repeat protein